MKSIAVAAAPSTSSRYVVSAGDHLHRVVRECEGTQVPERRAVAGAGLARSERREQLLEPPGVRPAVAVAERDDLGVRRTEAGVLGLVVAGGRRDRDERERPAGGALEVALRLGGEPVVRDDHLGERVHRPRLRAQVAQEARDRRDDGAGVVAAAQVVGLEDEGKAGFLAHGDGS